MAQNKNFGAANERSTTNKKIAHVENVGQPKRPVNQIKQQFDRQEKRRKIEYAAASEDKVIKKIRDVAKNGASVALSGTNKKTVKGYLTGDIYSNSNNLIKASRYLYYRSPIYSKMCNAYANMYCLECRMVSPNYNFSKPMDANKSLKQFENTLSYLDLMALKNNMAAPLLNMWIQDVSYNLFFHDDTGAMFYPIDASECMIDSVYEVDGGMCFGFAMDMSKWRNAQKQQIIEWLGDPLQSMWNEYQKTNVKYVHVPAEYSMVLKHRVDTPDVCIPPLLPYLSQMANLNDLVDAQATADELSFYRMIYLPLKVRSAAKNLNEFEIDPDMAIDYFKILQDSAFPEGVSSGIIPGEELKTIDFSDSVSEDIGRVETSQQQILGSAGGVGALLNATKAVNNTELIKSALKSESAYVLNGVLGQIEAWTNLQLMLEVSNYCHTSYLPVTIFTKEDYRKNLLESLQYSYSYRLAYGTLLGFSERQTMAQLKFETEVLGLPELMKNPLSSSFTSNGDEGEEKGKVGEGRPEKDAGELSPSGERSRNK